jgi:hypothetical protein
MTSDHSNDIESDADVNPDDWDANDARRRADSMAPPQRPCECRCLHCGRVYMSDQMWFQRIRGSRSGFDGFWMCPTPNCSGAGFTFDVFPTDPDHPANAGWSDCDCDGDDEEALVDDPDEQWDPREAKYQADDELDDDMEGEEWKLGIVAEYDPSPPEMNVPEGDDENFDEPDRRPREIDWSNREEPPFSDEDIPF